MGAPAVWIVHPPPALGRFCRDAAGLTAQKWRWPRSATASIGLSSGARPSVIHESFSRSKQRAWRPAAPGPAHAAGQFDARFHGNPVRTASTFSPGSSMAPGNLRCRAPHQALAIRFKIRVASSDRTGSANCDWLTMHAQVASQPASKPEARI